MTLPAEIESIVNPVLDRMGLALVIGSFHRERSGKVLRLLVERRGATVESGSGVDVGLCAVVSREVSTALDVSDVINDSYVLEVSSPGLERPLIGLGDFDRFSGRRAKVRTAESLNGMRHFEGTLNGVVNDAVVLTMSDNEKVSIPHEMIKRAHLVFEFKK